MVLKNVILGLMFDLEVFCYLWKDILLFLNIVVDVKIGIVIELVR